MQMNKVRAMDRRICLKTFAALAVSAACPFATFPVFAQAGPEGASSSGIRRQLRFTVTLTNPHAKELNSQMLWLYLPVAHTATQQLDALNVSAEYRLQTDCLGHSIVELEFAHFPPLAQRIIVLVADVTLRAQPVDASLDDPKIWLVHERYIEMNDPRIQALAHEMKRTTPLETAKAIFEWVSRNLAYGGYVADDVGALRALIQQSGDCTEFAYLAVALARANQIPARMVGGYVVDKNAVLRMEEHHNWAEVYVNGGWRLLDAQKQNWLTPTEQYVAFRYYRDEMINALGLAHRFKVEGDLQVRL